MFEALALPGEGDRRQVSALVRLLGLSESDYEEAIELARELLDNPSMQAWIARTTSRLQRTGYLDGESIAALRPTTRTKEAVPA